MPTVSLSSRSLTIHHGNPVPCAASRGGRPQAAMRPVSPPVLCAPDGQEGAPTGVCIIPWNGWCVVARTAHAASVSWPAPRTRVSRPALYRSPPKSFFPAPPARSPASGRAAAATARAQPARGPAGSRPGGISELHPEKQLATPPSLPQHVLGPQHKARIVRQGSLGRGGWHSCAWASCNGSIS